MALRRFVIPVTVDENGDAEVYSPVLSGEVVSIRYIKDDFAGVDLSFEITSEKTGATLWAEDDVTASATRHPLSTTQTILGADALYADAGEDVLDLIALTLDRVRFVIAGAGDQTSGTFHLTIDG